MPANRFHVRELSRAEFTALLLGIFRHVRVVLQRPLIGSALLADTGSPAPALVFDRRGDTHFEACIGLPRAPYLIAVASDRELPPLPPAFILIETISIRRRFGDWRSPNNCDRRRQNSRRRRNAPNRQRSTPQRRCGPRNMRRCRPNRRRGMPNRRYALAPMSEERNEALQRRHDQMQGSLRTFLRGYLPLLRRHLLGQRP